jgi:uncharacterized protein
VPSFVTNVWQLAAGASFTRLAHRLWPMLAGVVLGTLAGTGLLTGSHAGQAAVALGLLLMLYAVLGLTSVRFSVSPAAEWWLGPLIGALTGLATAATGVFAIPAVPYLGALNLDKEDVGRLLVPSCSLWEPSVLVKHNGRGACPAAIRKAAAIREAGPRGRARYEPQDGSRPDRSPFRSRDRTSRRSSKCRR